MGKLIVVVGNSGVGKSTLVRALCQQRPFVVGLEQHAERPFQQLFADNLTRYSLANQLDYLLLRAEQELAIREQPGLGLQDGGLDQDFQVYARRFHQRSYLTDAEFGLCARQYDLLRRLLPAPDLYIYLIAPLPVVASRFVQRARSLEIAAQDDLVALDRLVQAWMATLPPERVVVVDATHDDFCAPSQLTALVARMEA